ncbi:MAG: pyruvate dehydrogenase (acetyl-transferring) E1 component subunit alpha [Nanoarchaeota archaeon]
MSKKVVARYKIEYVQVLDENGKVDAKFLPDISNKELLEVYRLMLRTRLFDSKGLLLQRQGRVGTLASCQGQEATQVGAAYAVGKDDWIFPLYRDWGAFIARGAPLHQLYQYSAGDERSMNLPKAVNLFPIQICVGSQALHAVGAAMAASLKGESWASLVFLGDGATSVGDVSEAMNFAGVFVAPVVFVIENNQWAISVSRSCAICKGRFPCSCQSMAQTLAQKAFAAGISGVQVDGMDVLAVIKVVGDALIKARNGKGPSVIECLTYRFSDHTTADDASRYRDPKEVEQWRLKDPILRLKKFLIQKKMWSEQKDKELVVSLTKEVEDEVQIFEKIPVPDPTDFFDWMYEYPTPDLVEQKQELIKILHEKKEGGK